MRLFKVFCDEASRCMQGKIAFNPEKMAGATFLHGCCSYFDCEFFHLFKNRNKNLYLLTLNSITYLSKLIEIRQAGGDLIMSFLALFGHEKKTL